MSLGGGGITIAGGGGGGSGATDQDVLKRDLWTPAPSPVIDETLPKWAPTGSSVLTSGTLRIAGQVVVPAAKSVAKIGAYASAGVVTPTNQWFCLIDPANNQIVAVTADDTTTAWASNTFKELTVASGPYAPGVNKALWLAVNTTAATPVGLPSTTAVGFTNATPKMAFNSTASLTTPLAVTTVVSLGANSSPCYAYIA